MCIFPADFIVENKKRLNVECPDCKKGNLIIRQNTENQTYFLGCTQYPDCRHAEPFQVEAKEQKIWDFIEKKKWDMRKKKVEIDYCLMSWLKGEEEEKPENDHTDFTRSLPNYNREDGD